MVYRDVGGALFCEGDRGVCVGVAQSPGRDDALIAARDVREVAGQDVVSGYLHAHSRC